MFRASRVQTYTLTMELAASPDALWPFVSNTEKMNRATGLAPVRFEIEEIAAAAAAAPGGTMGSATTATTTGHQRVGGFAMRWREHPYEWIEGTRHVVLRVFDKGVLRWYVADVQLERTAGGGTRLRNTIRLEPRGSLARVLSRWEIGVKYRRALDRVYARLDKLLVAGTPPEIDPIEPDVALAKEAHAHVLAAGDKLIADGVAPEAADVLVAFLSHASDQDVARIRPLELAAKFHVAEDAMVEVCLRAAKLGILAMVWDVICPSCKIPSNVVESLAKIEEHARCEACNVGFDVDFSRAIELAFRASPELREVETRTYCLGGPAHFPHVAAQVRLAPKERYALALTLGPGFYLVRSPQLPRHHELRVTASGGVRRMDLTLGQSGGGAMVAPASAGGIRETAPLTAGDQLIAIANPTDSEILVRVERAGDRAFALTAARVMSTAAFRELFPDQALAPGRLMSVTQASLLVAQLDDAPSLFRELGDAKAFPVAERFFAQLGALAKERGGTLVKTFGGLAIAAFERPGPAVEAALALQRAVDVHPVTTGLRVRVACHRGPLMALTHGGRLDYFGQNVELALEARGCRRTRRGRADRGGMPRRGRRGAPALDARSARHAHAARWQLGAPRPRGPRRGAPRCRSWPTTRCRRSSITERNSAGSLRRVHLESNLGATFDLRPRDHHAMGGGSRDDRQARRRRARAVVHARRRRRHGARDRRRAQAPRRLEPRERPRLATVEGAGAERYRAFAAELHRRLAASGQREVRARHDLQEGIRPDRDSGSGLALRAICAPPSATRRARPADPPSARSPRSARLAQHRAHPATARALR